MRKDLLSINSLSKQEIEELISYAIRLKEQQKDGGGCFLKNLPPEPGSPLKLECFSWVVMPSI